VLFAVGNRPGVRCESGWLVMDLSPFVVAALLVAFLLGWGLRDTCANGGAGVVIRLTTPFRPGDWIESGHAPGHVGRVSAIGWLTTTLVEADASTLIMPNSLLLRAWIRRCTEPPGGPLRRAVANAPGTAAPPRQESLAAVLGRVNLLASLNSAELETLAASAAEHSFAAGAAVIRQGDPGTSMYVIETGRVAVTAALGAGEPTTLAVLGPGDFFGEMSLLTGAARSATVTALDETRLIVIDKEGLGPMIKARPELAERLGAALADREAGRLEAVVQGGPAAPPPKQDLLQRIIDFLAS
jgi:CRP-like cAMP-binding protein